MLFAGAELTFLLETDLRIICILLNIGSMLICAGDCVTSPRRGQKVRCVAFAAELGMRHR
jgi:hypothetical protein